ncbi:MAG: hypothetical protein M3237_13625 [Actinomycetota bacterium]|nr:hypothetical protein [Actinomycetota bacterium]
MRTSGCQMNVHDSDRIAGLLDGAGLRPGRGQLGLAFIEGGTELVVTDLALAVDSSSSSGEVCERCGNEGSWGAFAQFNAT